MFWCAADCVWTGEDYLFNPPKRKFSSIDSVTTYVSHDGGTVSASTCLTQWAVDAVAPDTVCWSVSRHPSRRPVVVLLLCHRVMALRRTRFGRSLSRRLSRWRGCGRLLGLSVVRLCPWEAPRAWLMRYLVCSLLVVLRGAVGGMHVIGKCSRQGTAGR